jgi:hypothetical protein
VSCKTLTGLDMLAGFNINAPPFTAIVPVETLGTPAA